MVFSKDFKGQVKISEVKACLDDLVNNTNKQIDLYNTSDYVQDINYNIGAPDLAPLNYTLSVGGLKKFLNAYNGCVIGCKAFNIGDQYAVSDGIMFLQDGCHRIPAQIIPSLPKTLEYSPSNKIYKGQKPEGEAKIYLGTDGLIYLKAGKYSAVKDGTIVDYELTTDTVCQFEIPSTYYDKRQVRLPFTYGSIVPSELPAIDTHEFQGEGFVTAIKQVKSEGGWTGATYAKYPDESLFKSPMKFGEQLYTLYTGSTGKAFFDIDQYICVTFPESETITDLSYQVTEPWQFSSTDTFTLSAKLFKKSSPETIIAEGTGTVAVMYDNSKRNAYIYFAEGVTIEANEQYIIQLHLGSVPRYASDSNNYAYFSMKPNLSFQTQKEKGSVKGTFNILLDSDGSLMVITYAEIPFVDNGDWGTINWENGIVTSITPPEAPSNNDDSITDWIYICDLNPNRDIALSNAPNLAVCNVGGMYITSQTKNVGLETIEARDISKAQFVSGVPRDAKGAKGSGNKFNIVKLLGEYVGRSFQRAKRAAGGLAIYNKLFLPKGIPNPYTYEGNGAYGANGQKVFDANVTRNS
jgi:hypothetical protein